MRAFFRAILRAEPQVDDELADRLSRRLTRSINRMLVWDARPQTIADNTNVDKPAIVEKDAIDSDTINEAGAPWPDADTLNPPQLRLQKNKKRKKKKKIETREPFDPYAFSAVVVLARGGPDALMAKLKEIKTAEHLRKLADAQHLGISVDVQKTDELRRAIINGASQRLADRRAAAS